MDPWLTRLAYFLLPGRCIACHGASRRQMDLCAGCQRDLPRQRHTCWQCGLEVQTGLDTCAACIANPPAFSHCYSAFRYESPLDHLISLFKTQKQLSVGRVLGLLLAHSYRRDHADLPDLWVPVPLHASALRQRGFNQAEILCATLSERTTVPMSLKPRRIFKTRTQKQLNKTQRVENLKGAFAANDKFHGMSIGIVDDVITTGATVTELTNVLLAAGATDVQVVSIARTPRASASIC